MIDPNIIFQIRQPNMLAAMREGTQNAAAKADVMRTADVQNALRQYGPGAMRGEAPAVNALAAYDPQMVQGLQAGQLDMQATRQGMAMDREKMQMLRDQTARELAAAADQEAAMREAEDLNRTVQEAVRAYASGDDRTWNNATSAAFGQPLPRDEEGLAVLGAFHEGAKAYLDARPKPEKPGFRNATPAEAQQYGAQAGQFGPDGRFYPINPPRGMSVEVGPDGTTRIVEGAGVGTGGDPTIGAVVDPAEIASTVGLIGEVYNDPNLASVTGRLQGGGGNNPEDLNMFQNAIIGEQGPGLVAKIGQIQSRGWLAARQMLKGGGPITDYESRKAEAAVARLQRTQNEADFKAALKDFHDAIREGMIKLQDAGKLSPGVQIPPALGVNAVQPAGGSSRAGGGTSRAGGAQPASIPPQAVQMLQSDPSPEAVREFDEVFGQGAASRVLGQ